MIPLIPGYKRISGKMNAIKIIGMISIIIGLVICIISFFAILAISGYNLTWWFEKEIWDWWRYVDAGGRSAFFLGVLLILLPVQNIFGKIVSFLSCSAFIGWYFSRTNFNVIINVDYNFITLVYLLFFITAICLLISAIRRKTRIKKLI